MLARLYAALVALTLSACAAHEAPPAATGSHPEQPPEPAKVPHAELKLAIASVTMQQDCPDPPEPVAAPVAPIVPADPAAAPAQAPQPKRGSMQQGDQESPMLGATLDRRNPGSGPWQQPCTQSSMQLSLTNTGDAPGKLEIKAVRLLDNTTKKPLGTLTSRRPSLWIDTSTAYQPWDEQTLPGATLKVSYSLGEPDWTAVGTNLGHTNFYTAPLLLEVDIAVDGTVQTLRSPEFMRQEVHLIVT